MLTCALCGNEIEGEPYRFAVTRAHKGDKPEAIAITRPLCQRCAYPEQQTEFVTTLRRIPAVLDEE